MSFKGYDNLLQGDFKLCFVHCPVLFVAQTRMRPQMVWLERYSRFMVEADISK